MNMPWIDPIRQKLYRPRKALVAGVQSLPEQAQFLVRARPDPSSTILLAGSGRSGTTWLADMLTMDGKTQQIFEPLHPYFMEEVRQVTGWPKDPLRIRLFYLRPNDFYPEWQAFFDRVLSGRVRAWGWTDHQRTSYLPERYLIKEIRANLLLGYLYNTFHLPILYIVRHPCAVVLSRLQMPSVCDIGLLLAQEALVEDHLRPWLREIEGVSDRLESLAIWWAIENMVAQRQLASIPHLLLTYEDLVLAPQRELARACDFVGLPLPTIEAEMIQASSRTSRGAVYASTVARLGNWRKKLTTEQQQRILFWAHRFGVDLYDEEVTPIGGETAARPQEPPHGK